MSRLAKISKQVRLDLAQLAELADRHRQLIDECQSREPTAVEIDALAALLHSFYTGVENLLKRIAVAFDGGTPKGEFWHVALLDSMAGAGESRPAVLSDELKKKLKEYLNFRHVFRHAYSFDLQWRKMAALVLGMAEACRQVETEVKDFLSKIDPE